MGRTLKSLGRLFVVTAMIVAIGGHWAVLQSVAWTTMIVANAQSENFSDALKNTFDGDHPCELCKRIESGRQSEKKQDPQASFSIKKIDLFHQYSAVALLPPVSPDEDRDAGVFAETRPLEPVLQPPEFLTV